ncbi:MAG: glycosyltransferase family 2 protein [Desulfobaccales bacterium]
MDNSTEQAYFVSVITPARNEERYIGTLLNDFLHQDYPSHLRELIVVDGNSEDNTKSIVQEFARLHPELNISVLDNPQRLVAPGYNLGLRAARGQILCRVDAHASIPPDYLRIGVHLLQEHAPERVGCVGGVTQTVGAGFWGRAFSAMLNSPFGVGNAKFRYANKPGYVDTIAFYLFWRKILDEVGFYRENLVRSEDLEFNARIRRRGWKFFLYPQLRTTTQARSSLGGFLKQAFGNGFWTMATWRVSCIRHFIPFLFAGTVAILGVGGLLSQPFYEMFGALVFIYGAVAIYFSFKSISGYKDWPRLLILPPLFFLLHMSYGIGSWWALLSDGFKKARTISA